MCVVCSTIRQRQSHEQHRAAMELAQRLTVAPPLKPRTLLYGLFSESFELLGKKYCWVVEGGVLTLQKVTWDEEW